MNLNTKQIISIVGAILSVLMISTAQLTDLFGAGVAKSIVSVAGLGNLILQSIMTAITSQSATVSSVADIANDRSQPQSSDARQALIAATISLPEVQTIVTDKKTADAAPSESVVAAEAVSIVPTK